MLIFLNYVSKTIANILLKAGKFLQSYARNLRAPALTCVQDDSILFLSLTAMVLSPTTFLPFTLTR